MKYFLHRYWLLLLFALAGIFIHLFLVHPAWQLHRDELLYLAEGNHPAWGYLEVPPTMALLAMIIKFLGGAVWMVRLVPALFGALTLFFTGKIVMELGGGLYAQLLACLAYLASGYLRLNLLFQPNSPEVFYFTLGAYFIIRYIHTSHAKYVLYTGIVIGLGMMNKYSMLLFAIGLLAGMALTPHRKLFKNKYCYLAGAIAFLIYLPNFLWQVFHHFPVVNHMETLATQQLQYNSATGFLTGQVINCLPSLFIWVAGLIYFLFIKKGKPYRLLAWMYLAVVTVLIVTHGKDYYAMGSYPMLMAGGGIWLEQLTRKKNLRLLLRPVMILVPVAITMLLFPLLIPLYSPAKMADYCARYKAFGLTRWEDGKEHALPQDYADMLGWKKMAMLAGEAYTAMDSTAKAQTIIFCDNYGQAGAVDYYGGAYHLPAAKGKEASYILWSSPDMQFKNIILVTDDPEDVDNPLLKDNFKSVKMLGSIDNGYAREAGSLVLLCEGANEKVVQFVNERNRRLKNQFR